MLDLAVLLTAHADGEKIWDEDIRILDAEGRPEAEEVDLFLSLEEAHRPMIERRDLLPKTVIVTKKVREGGWKIGYGLRDGRQSSGSHPTGSSRTSREKRFS